MKKIILILVIGILLIRANLYAAGDLIVNGLLGVGASTPGAKIDINQTTTTGNTAAFRSNLNKSSNAFVNASYFSSTDSSVNSQGFNGMAVNPWHTGSGSSAGKGFDGAMYMVQLRGSATALESLKAQDNMLWIRGVGDYNVSNTDAVLSWLVMGQGSGSGATHTLTKYSGFHSGGSWYADTVNGTDWAHFRADDFPLSGHGTVAQVAGVWIEKQTFGTNKYGIVLNGDGAGADIVFGSGKCCRIYSEAGALRAQDGSGNITQFSPHDPVTGEWIFYSQNINTGRTVRVNMEKLVKAVEKLTGETFMIETLIEDK